MKLVWNTFRDLLHWLPGDAKSYLWRYILVSCLLTILDITAIMLLALCLAPMMLGASINFPVVGGSGPTRTLDRRRRRLPHPRKSVLAIVQQWFATRKFASFELEIGRRLFDAYIKAPWTHRLARNTAAARPHRRRRHRQRDERVPPADRAAARPPRELRHDPRDHHRRPAAHRAHHRRLPRRHHGADVLGRLGQVGQAGRVSRDYSLKVAALMTEMVQALKEITLRNKASEVADVVNYNRSFSTRARANMNFLGSLPRSC